MNEVEPLILTKPKQIWMYSISFNDNKSHKLIKFKLKMSFPSSSLYSLVIRRDKKADKASPLQTKFISQAAATTDKLGASN